jgi:hypothetical protein
MTSNNNNVDLWLTKKYPYLQISTKFWDKLEAVDITWISWGGTAEIIILSGEKAKN